MADEEIATKAPESDAAQNSQSSEANPPAPTAPDAKLQQHTESAPSGSTEIPAQSSSTIGEHCTTDRPLPSTSQNSIGETSMINDVAVYISKPPGYPHQPGKLLLFLTGGTGIQSINNQLQADMFASRGYVVVMPDQFNGDPAPNTSISEEDAQAAAKEQDTSWLGRFKLGAVETAKSFLIDMWLARHTPEKVLPILQKVLEGMREQFADAEANGGGTYGVGYCFGAKYILQLLAEPAKAANSSGKESADEEAGAVKKGPELKAGVIAHGTLITKEDIESIQKPIAMACVSNDSLFPDDVREQGRATLELNTTEHDIRVFEGVPHGFAVVGDYNDQKIKEMQQEAYEFMAQWLDGH